MRSEHILPEIQAYIDDELSPVGKLRVRRHLAACQSCQEEYASVRSLNALLRLGDAVSKVDSAPVMEQRRPGRLILRWSATAAIMLAVMLAVFIAPHSSHYSDPNAAIAAALDGVDTWHFSGWKQVGGKRVPWDIWGRRNPYFSYERVGADITICDGKTTRRILAPDPELGRPAGLVIDTSPSGALDAKSKLEALFAGLTEPDMSTMVTWNWTQGGGMFMPKPFRQTASVISFRRQWYRGGGAVNSNRVFTVSKRTWLPVRYEFDNKSVHGDWNTEYLAAHYNVDLPTSVTKVVPPPGYVNVNLVGADLKKLNDAAYRFGPFDISSRVVAVDGAGNAIVKIDKRLNGHPLTSTDQSSFSISNMFDPDALITAVGTNQRETTRYIRVINMFGQTSDDGTPFLLVPLDAPILPATLRLNPSFGMSITLRDTDGKDEFGHDMLWRHQEPLISGHLPMSIVLDRRTMVPSLDAAMPIQWKAQLRNTTLMRRIYQQKADYYHMSNAYDYKFWLRHRKEYAPMVVNPTGQVDLSKPIPQQKAINLDKKYAKERESLRAAQQTLAIYWRQKSLEAVKTLPEGIQIGEAADDYRVLAIYYRDAGDRNGMRGALRKELALYKRMYPAHSILVRQVEYELETGSLAGDADYKGPS